MEDKKEKNIKEENDFLKGIKLLNKKNILNQEILKVSEMDINQNAKVFPKVIMNNILKYVFIAAIVFIVTIVGLIINLFNLYILIISIPLILFFGWKALYPYITIKSNTYITFIGNISASNEIGFRNKNKRNRITVIDVDDEKTLTFDYLGNKKYDEGTPVTLYVEENEQIIIIEEGPYIANYLGVEFFVYDEEVNELLNNPNNTTIEKYIKK